MTSILLVRHAHAAWRPDEMRPLSDEGRRDAERLPDQLSAFRVAAVYSSPYRRSIETVAPLARRLGLPIREHPDPRERALGAWASPSFEEAVAATWKNFDFAHPGGESNRAAQGRAAEVVRSLAERHRGEVVVAGTHGNLLALILNVFDSRVAFGFWSALQFPDVVQLTLDGSGEGTYERVLAGH